MFFYRVGGSQNQCGSTVVDARSIAGGDGFVWAVDRFQFGQRVNRGVSARMFVLADHGFALLVGDPHFDDFFGEVARSLRGSSALLTA
ncbi:hypothetical protein D3C78_1701560 [compost metagenome]